MPLGLVTQRKLELDVARLGTAIAVAARMRQRREASSLTATEKGRPRVNGSSAKFEEGAFPTAQALKRFLDASPTPFHCAANAASLLRRASLEAHQGSGAKLGDAGYFLEGGSLVAWRRGLKPSAGIRIIAAHTDSPNLRLKPNWLTESAGYRQLNVDVYGRVLLHTWLDRDLSLAGRVILEQDGRLRSKLVNVKTPLCRVPSLAVHLDPDVNERGLVLNKHLHMSPILGQDTPHRAAFLRELSLQLGIDPRAIRGHDLCLYDNQPAAIAGLGGEFIHSARLDNQVHCHAAIRALAQLPKRLDATCVVALFDHEEVGSLSGRGAAGEQLKHVIQQLSEDGVERSGVLAKSLVFSADAGHALHPNYQERHDATHAPVLNGGPMLKTNVNQRYATDAIGAAIVRQLSRQAKVPLQEFVNRPDLHCGTTIGPRLFAKLGITTVDVGVPLLSMHSIREQGGVGDQRSMQRLLSHAMTVPKLPAVRPSFKD